MIVSCITQVQTSNAFLIGMCAVLALATYQLGPLAMINLYVIPYWINVVWLDIVTYLHHHGAHDPDEAVPWYRGEVMPRFLSDRFSSGVRCGYLK
jgi:omega-3 fatty acid desaturase (delta-15 desaturase)